MKYSINNHETALQYITAPLVKNNNNRSQRLLINFNKLMMFRRMDCYRRERAFVISCSSSQTIQMPKYLFFYWILLFVCLIN